MRPDLSETGCLRDDPDVSSFVVGIEETIEDASKSTGVAIIAFVFVDVVKAWMGDRFSMACFGADVSSDVVQAVVGAVAGIAVGASS